MSMFAGRLGLALVLAALCLGGRTAYAQAAPVTYWIPSWPIGFGGNLTAGQSSNTYGNFPSFDGRDARGGGFSYTRYNFPIGGMGLSMNGINQDAAFGNVRSLYYEGVQFGYTFQNAPLTVYAGFDTLKYNTGIGGPFAPSTPRPAHCPAIARMRASNSSRRRMSACHSGSATPNSRGASTATSIRSRCPALLRLPSTVAANARFSRGKLGQADRSAAAATGSDWTRSGHFPAATQQRLLGIAG